MPRSMGASGKASVIPKNSEKCSFIMNCVKQNASDRRPPPKFVLPQLEALCDCLLLQKRKRVYMIKFDVSNCCWSILMPKRCRDIFQVSVSELCLVFFAVWLEIFACDLPALDGGAGREFHF